MNRNHPIIIRFSGPNHPIEANWFLCAQSLAADNRPIFRRESSDAAVVTVRNRQAKGPNRQIVETAMRDSASLKPEGKLQSLPEGQDKLKVIEAEARETDKALNGILEKLGV